MGRPIWCSGVGNSGWDVGSYSSLNNYSHSSKRRTVEQIRALQTPRHFFHGVICRLRGRREATFCGPVSLNYHGTYNSSMFRFTVPFHGFAIYVPFHVLSRPGRCWRSIFPKRRLRFASRTLGATQDEGKGKKKNPARDT